MAASVAASDFDVFDAAGGTSDVSCVCACDAIVALDDRIPAGKKDFD
jgi:hypothetical protein